MATVVHLYHATEALEAHVEGDTSPTLVYWPIYHLCRARGLVRFLQFPSGLRATYTLAGITDNFKSRA